MNAQTIDFTCDECNRTLIVGRGEDGEPCPGTMSCSAPGCRSSFCECCEEGEEFFRCDECGSLLCRDHRATVAGEPVCFECVPKISLEGAVWITYRSNLTGRPVRFSYVSLDLALHSLRYAGVAAKDIVAIDSVDRPEVA
jgi:hypothetical protein